jgi:predicted hydrolase (HD superfamily)
MIPNKQQTIEILKKYVTKEANIDHCLLVGYGMLGISKYLNKPENEQDYWFAVGTLHDIDIELFGEDIKQHTIIGEKLLKQENIDPQIIEDIQSHNEAIYPQRTKDIQHALFSLDGLTGIIRAYVLMRPDKNIQNAETKSILKKIKDKYFATAINREKIQLCETTLNIPLEKFIDITLTEIKLNWKKEI